MMIIYATKQTFERYKLKLPEKLNPPINVIAKAVIEKESGDRLLEWGAKLFYFDGRKCIQLVNFSGKFTLFLVDIKVSGIQKMGEYISEYLLELYKTDKRMTKGLKKMFEAAPMLCFAKLTDRSAIATLNTTQTGFADNGYLFYNYIRDGVLHTLEINHKVNFNWPFTMKIDGKTQYIYAGEKFKELVLQRYG